MSSQVSEDHKVIFFETGPWEPEDLCPQEIAIPGYETECVDEPLQEAEGDFVNVDCISVFIGSQVDAAQLDRFPDLRLIATRSTGYDHVDLEACRERGIAVSNVPRYGEKTVAEHTFGMILGLSRRIFEAHERTRRGDFRLWGIRGFDLYGKTLGVVGAGAIGLHVIRIGRAMGMECVAHDVAPRDILAEVLNFEYVDLKDLLGRSDVVSLHVPLVPDTRHMINAETLAQMKEGALLINTARGELVDTAALLDAIDTGWIAGAGLDVFEGEKLVGEEEILLRKEASRDQLEQVVSIHALLRHERTIVTPHMAFYSEEAIDRITNTTLANITGFFAGEPRNLVLPPQ